ncbi:MAG: glycerate dehydrogenase [Opitutaceae bacterium]|jgi:glycerate dehydrogenase|nr:glycerate dehydrogenase [Opitutaceae bacterium]
MKIVVLDGYVLNPGDLSWDALRTLGDCEVHDRTSANQIVARAAEAEVVLTNKCPLSAETIGQLPNLKYIGVMATGYNVVDVAAAKERGIVVSNVPIYGTKSVAQHVFALILEHAQNVGAHAAAVNEGRWSKNIDWCFWDHSLSELDGKTLGIVGYGRIGQAVADLGRAFGMKVIVASRTAKQGVEQVSIDELFQRSDVVSLHCPQTPETEGLVNAQRIELMKPSALLVNTSRGPLVVEEDLAAALNAGRIGGAALDVLSSEPPSPDNPLLSAKNCFVTPHIAWATQAARTRLLGTVVENIRAFAAGNPQNVVS